MRCLALFLALCGPVQAQVQYEAEQLYRNAALRAFGNLPQLELNATITFFNEGMKPIPKLVSIIVSKPGNSFVSTRMITGTQTEIVSGGNLWADNTYYHLNGLRPAEMRPDAFLIDPASREVVPQDWPLVRARMAGTEDLLIEGRVFPTKKIEVTFRTPGLGTPTDVDDTLWIEEKSGVPLKRIRQPQTARGPRTEVVVTRFRTEGPLPADAFRTNPGKDSAVDAAVFSRTMIAAPTGGDATFSLPTSDGMPFTLIDLGGRPAILVFGRPDCKPCADEAEEFEVAAKRLKATGAEAFQIGWGSPSGSESGRTVFASWEQMEKFGIQVFPATMAVSPDGRIARIEEGLITADEMVALAEKARTMPRLSQIVDAGYVFASQPGVVAPVPIYKERVDTVAWTRAGKASGDVSLSVIVAKDGSVVRANVIRSLSPELDAIAVETIGKWVFTPGTRDGQPANVAVTVVVRFGSK